MKHIDKIKNMKKRILLIFTLLCFVVSLNAQQSPWRGFIKPVKHVVAEDLSEIKVENFNRMEKYGFNPDSIIVKPDAYMFFRPTFMLSFAAIDFYEKPAVIKSLEIAGVGISYGKFSADNQAYCEYSVNALLISSYKFGDVQGVKIGGAITADIFNKLIGGGVGYIDGKFMPLITLSHSF
jgi:hypothetical protein